ncbi:DUF2178 domain-containing protein [Salinirubrum litoreum]|uniref:DUF2178 domain-containing protein n=1 Tax=Salinirubrum litoreum TaxID=1126234 RepID=A0ABD5R711_9EURY|nr:DUF2178 domain-containing protein [Salinirubrum litoreum]
MTATVTSQSGYRRLYVLSWVLGTAGYVGLLLAGQVVAGVVVFLLGGAAAVALSRRAGTTLLDERDASVLETASANTLLLVGVASAVTFPTVVVLDALGRLTFPAWLAPVGLFVAGLFGLWAVMLLLARAEYR